MIAVPVTVITGYLGAGKTTLLRRIIERSGNLVAGAEIARLAVLMNEFGEIAIDSRVVEGKNISMVELLGGCVCCSLSGEFGAAVAEMLKTIRPEWIVVETTGVAEPAALAYDISKNIPGVKLDSIVTIVDADSMARFPSLGHTGREQIELADIIILNKTDLVSKDTLTEVLARLVALNPRATIIESERCAIDVGVLSGVGRADIAKKHKIHEIGFEYFDFEYDGALGHDSLTAILGAMPPSIYRAKGFVRTEKGGFLLNYVAGRHELEPFGCEKTELVFIGKGALSHKDATVQSLESARIS